MLKKSNKIKSKVSLIATASNELSKRHSDAGTVSSHYVNHSKTQRLFNQKNMQILKKKTLFSNVMPSDNQSPRVTVGKAM